MDKLYFSKKANKKLRLLAGALGISPARITSIALPAGWTCASADKCKSTVDRGTKKLTDYGEFRCYAASIEMYSANYQKVVWRNLDLIKEVGLDDMHGLASLIMDSLPPRAEVVRMLTGGDFVSPKLMQAFILTAQIFPEIVFYGYTKNLDMLLDTRPAWPSNFRLTYSWGGKWDEHAQGQDISIAYVVFSEQEAEMKGLPIDYTDEHAFAGDHDFALMIHGIQPRAVNLRVKELANEV